MQKALRLKDMSKGSRNVMTKIVIVLNLIQKEKRRLLESPRAHQSHNCTVRTEQMPIAFSSKFRRKHLDNCKRFIEPHMFHFFFHNFSQSWCNFMITFSENCASSGCWIIFSFYKNFQKIEVLPINFSTDRNKWGNQRWKSDGYGGCSRITHPK